MSNHIEKSIKSYNKYFMLICSVKLDNPFGLVEWIINVLELNLIIIKNLREIIKLFMDFEYFKKKYKNIYIKNIMDIYTFKILQLITYIFFIIEVFI
jgi:hypothetical protein